MTQHVELFINSDNEVTKVSNRGKVVGVCVECPSEIYESDEMLPDWPTLYQCPNCSHPNGPFEKEN